MRSLQDISSPKLLFGVVAIFVFSSCDEASNIEVIDQSVVGNMGDELGEPIEIDFTNEIEQDTEDFACDPLVRRPNRDIEYSGREITIAEHFSFSPKSSTPGSDWCLDSDFETTENEV